MKRQSFALVAKAFGRQLLFWRKTYLTPEYLTPAYYTYFCTQHVDKSIGIFSFDFGLQFFKASFGESEIWNHVGR